MNNKSRYFTLIVVLCIALGMTAKKKPVTYAIGFYNQENLFDTCHDEGKNDYDFLPTGSYKWDTEKYVNKLKNMAGVLAEMGTDRVAGGCAFIGLAEVENVRCMDDLCAQRPLKDRNMKYVFFEGADKRGIDVAFIYNPSLFRVDSKRTELIPYASEDGLITRGFLVVHGTLAGEHVVCIVCHLPSRRSGDDSGRVSGARQVYAIKSRILQEDAKAKVFIMGDMNDDPTDRSMCEELRGKERMSDVKADDMYNPWIEVINSGTGTLSYRGKWNLFDQILLSPSLLPRHGKGASKKALTYDSNQIFLRDYLLEQEGRYKGTPKRTHGSGQWLNGYSDHLPVVVYVTK